MDSLVKNNKKKIIGNISSDEILVAIICAVIAVLFCIFFSHSTSPIFSCRLGDSDTFMLLGKGILEGKIPYTDLHENKGPLFFLLEALPQIVLKSPQSIFVFQCMLMSVNLYLLVHIAWKFFELDIVGAFIMIAAFMLPLMLTYTAGNMAEEYDVFFTIVGSYFYFKSDKEDRCENICCIVLGMCTMAVLMIKMPDAAGLLALDLMYILHPVFKKLENKLGIVLRRFLRLVVSAMVLLVLILLYYIVNDAILDMFYHYFYINFMMTNVDFKLSRLKMLLSWYGLLVVIPVMIALSITIFSYKYRKSNIYVNLTSTFFSILCAIATFVHTTGYIQHTMPVSVGYTFSFGCFMRLLSPNKSKHKFLRIAAYGIIIFVFALFLTKHFFANNYINPIRTDFSMAGRSDSFLLEYIPEDDRDSVYRFGETENGWYYYNDFYPYYKWLNLQTLIGIGLNEVADQFEYKMMHDPVKYLVYSGNIDDYEKYFSDKLIDYIEKHYFAIAVEYKPAYGCEVGVYKYVE